MTDIDPGVWALVALGGLYVMWVMLPLVPAILTFKLFPKTTVTASGPFAGFTVNASGAFAAYLLVFAATFEPIVPPGRDIIASWIKQFWTMRADVKLVQADGSHYGDSARLLEKLKVLKPLPHKFDGNRATFKFEEIEGEFPTITVEIPGFGERTITLRSMLTQLHINHFKRTIDVDGPIVIREESSGGATRPTASLQAPAAGGSTESVPVRLH